VKIPNYVNEKKLAIDVTIVSSFGDLEKAAVERDTMQIFLPVRRMRNTSIYAVTTT
jgi:hypothetical protein